MVASALRKWMAQAPTPNLLHWAQRGICPLCGLRMDELKSVLPGVREGPGQPTLDHVLPLSRYGGAGRGNLLLTHAKCNHAKANRYPTGCELIWLVAVCERLDWDVRLKPDMPWRPPEVKAKALSGGH